ncbi:hypothetical protein [Planomonospora sp. ID82291]|uniref:hypothetical protein n=1 Tax=Planomonospora sp. ID82291 TaxID=2738136 RepID=UPI0018C3878D|nr:hypothetical protein [Planomonospora sp. ID82291]MBG0818729.1 hypothetical protein [Planomonospora sp. ID82291]
MFWSMIIWLAVVITVLTSRPASDDDISVGEMVQTFKRLPWAGRIAVIGGVLYGLGGMLLALAERLGRLTLFLVGMACAAAAALLIVTAWRVLALLGLILPSPAQISGPLIDLARQFGPAFRPAATDRPSPAPASAPAFV